MLTLHDVTYTGEQLLYYFVNENRVYSAVHYACSESPLKIRDTQDLAPWSSYPPS